MTYNVKVAMPDGQGPDFVFTEQELYRYLVDVKADGYAELDRSEPPAEPLPSSGRATSTYAEPNDTTIEWTPSDTSD